MITKTQLIDANNDWYDEISFDFFNETDLQKIILSKIEKVYNNYYAIPFALPISYQEEKRIPDIALINKDFKDWYIVEIELSHHSLKTHVEPQIRVFSNGTYDPEKIVPYIVSKLKRESNIDKTSLFSLIENHYPKILLMVNEDVPEWKKSLSKYTNIYIAVYQVYEGTNGYEIHRISGHKPDIITNNSPCLFPNSDNLLEVKHPILLRDISTDEIIIYYFGKRTIWEKSAENKKLFLIPVHAPELPVTKRYVLERTENNDFNLRII